MAWHSTDRLNRIEAADNIVQAKPLRTGRSFTDLDSFEFDASTFEYIDSEPLSTTTTRFSATEECGNLQWDTFSRWCYCVCVVTFDVDLGQAIEVCAVFHYFIYYLVLTT